MIAWRIRFDDTDPPTYGYQILSDQLVTELIAEEDGTPKTGSFEYSFVEVTDLPAWYVAPGDNP